MAEGRITITESEILQEIEALLAEGSNGSSKRGITVQELANARGVSMAKARNLLRPLIVAGQLKQVFENRGEADGYLGSCTVKAYVRVGA